MKNYIKPQAFVWACHIAICIWYIVVYYQFNKDRARDCKDMLVEGDDGNETESCRHLLAFRTAPLGFVWLSFLLGALVQTCELLLLFS